MSCHSKATCNVAWRMFRPTCIRWQAVALTTDLLKSQLPQQWFGKQANLRVGIAVSGGVDSMALATLCMRLRKELGSASPRFVGIIIDHRLRPESQKEAYQVSKNLRDFGMRSHVLKLDWEEHGDPRELANPETIARTLRYRAFGKVCRQQGIGNLLFAHHADDQAETTLMRLANKYLGRGLAGMQPEAHIPECEGMWGVDDSGTPRALRDPRAEMLVESGGVVVLRPLLSYTKDRLIATCEQAGTPWVEDQTNKDPSLTLRNTVRQLHEGDRLPKALGRPNLCAMAASTREQMVGREVEARRIFESLYIDLDPQSGSANCEIPDHVVEQISNMPDSDHIKVILLRMLLLLAAPTRQIQLATLETASHSFLSQDTSSPSTIAIAEAAITRLQSSSEGTSTYEIRRTAPKKAAKKDWPEIRFDLPPTQRGRTPVWSQWQLWDERYWIRIRNSNSKKASPGAQVVVRFLTVEDLGHLYEELPASQRPSHPLRKRLAQVKDYIRTTLPVIEQVSTCKDSPESAKRSIVALPSLSCGRKGWYSKAGLEQDPNATGFCYDIRYKHVDDSLTEPLESAQDAGETL